MHFELGAPSARLILKILAAGGARKVLKVLTHFWASRGARGPRGAFSAAFLTVDRRIVLMHCMEKVLRDVRTLVGDFGTLLGPKLAVKSAYGTGPRWDRFRQ